jgi:hypothetical protein
MSVPLPLEALNSQAKRSNRLINRIFMIDGRMFIGNERIVFDCGKALRKTVTGADYVKAGGGDRFALFAPQSNWVLRGSMLLRPPSAKKTALPPTRYAIAGKRVFALNGRLYAVQALREGIKIIELK